MIELSVIAILFALAALGRSFLVKEQRAKQRWAVIGSMLVIIGVSLQHLPADWRISGAVGEATAIAASQGAAPGDN